MFVKISLKKAKLVYFTSFLFAKFFKCTFNSII